jgi:electron transfer flavoprotein-quinone oxidoreductase
VIEAHEVGDFSRPALAGYREKLDGSFVLQDLKHYRRAPSMLHIDRLYEAYPEVLCNFLERVYRIDGVPKEKLTKVFLKNAKEKMTARELLTDAVKSWRAV